MRFNTNLPRRVFHETARKGGYRTPGDRRAKLTREGLGRDGIYRYNCTRCERRFNSPTVRRRRICPPCERALLKEQTREQKRQAWRTREAERVATRARILADVKATPRISDAQIAARHGVNPKTVQRTAKSLSRTRGRHCRETEDDVEFLRKEIARVHAASQKVRISELREVFNKYTDNVYSVSGFYKLLARHGLP